MKKIPDSMTIGEARKLGRYGDEALVHLNKAEVKALEGMTYGHGLTINPHTGEKEAFLPFLLSALPALFPGIGAALGAGTGLSFLANPMVLSAIGSGLGTAIETGDAGKGLLAGLGGAALGGLGGKLLGSAAGQAGSEMAKGVAGKMAASAGSNIVPNVGMGVANTGGSMAASFAPNATQTMNSMVPNALANVGKAAAPFGMMQAGLVGMPGAMIASQEAMKYRETDDDRRKKARVDRAQQENFLAPREVMRAPADYRHGFDEEFSFFSPGGTLTPVTTQRQYANGGLVDGIFSHGLLGAVSNAMPGASLFQMLSPIGMLGYNRPGTPESRRREEEERRAGAPPRAFADGGMVRSMMPTPQLLAGRTMGPPPVNPSLGAWNGFRPTPRIAPTGAPAGAPAPVRVPENPGMVGGGGGLGRFAGGGGMDFMGGKSPLDGANMRMMMDEHRQFRRFAEGGLVQGPGDGTSDSIPAVINGNEPAAISDGEFIISADVVSALGNGSTKAGAAKLQAMVDAVRAGAA